MIFLNALFGYLCLLIVMKWATGSTADAAVATGSTTAVSAAAGSVDSCTSVSSD